MEHVPPPSVAPLRPCLPVAFIFTQPGQRRAPSLSIIRRLLPGSLLTLKLFAQSFLVCHGLRINLARATKRPLAIGVAVLRRAPAMDPWPPPQQRIRAEEGVEEGEDGAGGEKVDLARRDSTMETGNPSEGSSQPLGSQIYPRGQWARRAEKAAESDVGPRDPSPGPTKRGEM